MTPICKACGAPPDALIHTGGHPTRCHAFVGSGRCPKHTRKSPCSGEVAEVLCPDCLAPGVDGWTAAFRRCEAHGGAAGAARSLKSHRSVYHPKTATR